MVTIPQHFLLYYDMIYISNCHVYPVYFTLLQLDLILFKVKSTSSLAW